MYALSTLLSFLPPTILDSKITNLNKQRYQAIILDFLFIKYYIHTQNYLFPPNLFLSTAYQHIPIIQGTFEENISPTDKEILAPGIEFIQKSLSTLDEIIIEINNLNQENPFIDPFPFHALLKNIVGTKAQLNAVYLWSLAVLVSNILQLPIYFKLLYSFWEELTDFDISKRKHFFLKYLEQYIQYAKDQYYNHTAILSDTDFDKLYQLGQSLAKLNPTSSLAIITQQVGARNINPQTSYNHLSPMLSLKNAYSHEDLYKWEESLYKNLGANTEFNYIAEPKFDGVSISLVYEKDTLVRALSRGDGVKGDNLIDNILQIPSIPSQIPFSEFGIETIEIRGEILILQKDFTKIVSDHIQLGLTAPTNARNYVAGTIRLKDSQEVKNRNLIAYLYHVGFIKSDSSPLFHTHQQLLEFLAKYFPSPLPYLQSFTKISELLITLENIATKRSQYPFMIDGFVIKVNQLSLHQVLGNTAHHPRWAIAWKFQAETAITKIENIVFQVGRTGTITPVAKVSPTYLSGVTISSISLFNEKNIKDKDLRLGDYVEIERAGEVIPYIKSVNYSMRPDDATVIVFPKLCPICHTVLVKNEDEIALRCPSSICAAQVIEKIIYFASKDALDIKFLGSEKIKRFHKSGFLNSIADLYALPYDEIIKMEGIGMKSVELLKSSIENSKITPLAKIILGLGIRYIGKTTAEKIAQNIQHLNELRNWSLDDWEKIGDIGPKVANSAFEFFHNSDNLQLLNLLEERGLILGKTETNQASKTISQPGALTDTVFLFTGTLENYTRQQAKELVEQLGASVIDRVSKQLTYLVVGANPGQKLKQAEKILDQNQILSEDDFIKLLENIR